MQGHQQGGVGIVSVPAGIAHAVGDHAPFLRGGGKDLPAGAHTEGVGAAAVGQVDIETVVRRGQRPPRPAVLGPVDVLLQMLDAHAHGEGLAFHIDALFQQVFKAVPGGMAQGQNHMAAALQPLFAGFGILHSGNSAVFDDKPLKPGTEAHLAPQGDDLLPDAAHHVHQHIGAHMGLGVIGDALRRTVLVKLLQHPAHALVMGAGVQLAVGKGAGAALAELHVILRVQRAALTEGLHGGSPLLHSLPPLQHDGPCSGPGQHQGGEHTRRSKAHHHRPLIGLNLGNGINRGLVLGNVLPGPAEKAPFVRRRNRHGADIMNIVFLPGVQGALHQLKLPDLPGFAAQGLGGFPLQGGELLPYLQA